MEELEDIDLEELESRLYSQVYHISPETDENTVNSVDTVLSTSDLHNKKKQFRYFENPLHQQSIKTVPLAESTFIPLENTKKTNTGYSSIENNVRINPSSTTVSTDGNFDRFQNNITVNQYTVPVILRSDLDETNVPLKNGKYFTSWSKKNQKLFDRQYRLEQRKIEKRERNRANRKRKKALKENVDLLKSFMIFTGPNNQVNLNVNSEQNENVKLLPSFMLLANSKSNVEQVSDIICLSDDSDNECIIVEGEESEMVRTSGKKKVYTGFPKKYDETEGGKKPESDDDIIYIPPPPVEVINIDTEENTAAGTDKMTPSDINLSEEALIAPSNENSVGELTCKKTDYTPEERKELLNTPESTAYNDFLDNASCENVADKFNFSLHGSDFNSQEEFIRPAVPGDSCETESSCSTNEPTRDFNNSVKTIVFDEIEFPKEDIFSDKNLDTFGSYITPKRGTKPTKNALVSTNLGKDSQNDLSCDSSSESDYESVELGDKNLDSFSTDFNKKLPSLSLMQPAEETVKKITKSNNKQKNTNKRKSAKSESDCSDNIEKSSAKKKQPKKKKSNTNLNVLDSSETKSATNSEPSESDCSDNLEKSSAKKKQAKKKKSNTNLNLFDSSETKSATNSELQTKKKKQGQNVSEVKETATEKGKKSKSSDDGRTPKRKNKISGSKSSENDEFISNESNVETVMAEENSSNLVDKSKKTKKKSAPSKTSQQLENENVTSAAKSKKKKKSSSFSDNLLLENEVGNSEKAVDDLQISETTESTEARNIAITIIEDIILTKSQDKESKADTCNEKICDDENGNIKIEDGELDQNGSDNIIAENRDQIDNEEIIIVDSEQTNVSDLIVVDEYDSNSDIEIVACSDTEEDFQILDVGNDLELANCAAGPSVETIDVEDSSNSNLSLPVAPIENRENFDVGLIQSLQSDDPLKWQVSYKDRAIYLNMGGKKGPRCNKCRHFGHTALKCTEKPEPPSCTLCGHPNHTEPRCPNKLCTQCGNQGDYSTSYCWKCFKFRDSVCRLCNMMGHIERTCPDLWRRYHDTTEPGPIVIPQERKLVPRNQQWCSGCARRGHLEHECNAYHRLYPPSTPCIMNYEDVLYPGRANQPVKSSMAISLYNSVSTSPKSTVPSSSEAVPMIPPLFRNDRIVIPKASSPNMTVKISNKVLNPFSTQHSAEKNKSDANKTELNIVDSGDCASVGKEIEGGAEPPKKHNAKDIQNMMLSQPCYVIKDFLRKEMNELEASARHTDPKLLKSKLFKCDRLSQNSATLSAKTVREKSYWYRRLNMFIFGIHMFRDGKLHVNYLKKYLSEKKLNELDEHKRKSLLSSYCYIFGSDKHVNVSYYKIIKLLVQRSEEGKASKSLR